MNVLLIGSGGREHAIALSTSRSSLLSKLFLIPGNPGTEQLGENVNIDFKDQPAVTAFCFEKNIEFVIIGPEQPLVDGLSDYLRASGIKVFGPDKAAAEIESSKSFAKQLMQKYNIPTASFSEFNKEDYEKAVEYVKSSSLPLVIKADGLAAGKGVLICNSLNEALTGLENIFVNSEFGDAGNKIIIEEFMTGEEASIFAVTDGENFVLLPSAQDHKRIGNNDTGKNTGGMGAYAPAPIITDELLKVIETAIIKPTIDALTSEGRAFIGCLYCGLMITETGPKVVEFNCRFGDPETQAVLPLLDGDILKLFYSAADGHLDESSVKYSGGTAICVVAASKGYPDGYEKGFEITGLNLDDKNIVIYHAGTKRSGNKIVTNGGRVIGVTATIPEGDLKKAKEKAYSALSSIKFNGIYFRSDIADKGINRHS
ncbi:MAG: phosphoribosylamine--glycine ligase [Ignavibacteriaceae bacterium]|nr:phosphoribosylamine--glycine ligase [Ignavibacteriaceae bacterium]